MEHMGLFEGMKYYLQLYFGIIKSAMNLGSLKINQDFMECY